MAGLDLSKQVGPLPLGAWFAVVGGGLGIAYYTRRSTAAESEPTIVEDTSGQPGVGTGAVGGWVPTFPTAPVSTETPITTNEEWATWMIGELIGRRYDPVLVDSAIRNYISGNKLSVSETAIIAMALSIKVNPQPLPGIEGGPPSKVPSIPTPPKTVPGPVKPKPAPPKPKPTPKPAVRKYIVRPGDTLSKIGRKYNKSWQTIYNMNKKGQRRADGTYGMISNPNRIFPGWTLHV